MDVAIEEAMRAAQVADDKAQEALFDVRRIDALFMLKYLAIKCINFKGKAVQTLLSRQEFNSIFLIGKELGSFLDI